MGAPDRILVVGATGTLGRALLREARLRGYDGVGAARSGADIAVDLNSGDLRAVVGGLRPRVVFNCAAMTSIDDCERDPGMAVDTNAKAVGRILEACQQAGAYLVQVSTDHYHSGHGSRAHTESEPVKLVNTYARTKYAGEQFALADRTALVVRTNLVGFRGWPGRPTFVEWALAALEARAPVTLFDDYFTSSIDARQLSVALFDLLPSRPRGVLNVASAQVSSKLAFVQALAAGLGLPTAQCRRGSVRALAGPARAESLGLDVAEAERGLGRRLPMLSSVVASLLKEYRETR